MKTTLFLGFGVLFWVWSERESVMVRGKEMERTMKHMLERVFPIDQVAMCGPWRQWGNRVSGCRGFNFYQNPALFHSLP